MLRAMSRPFDNLCDFWAPAVIRGRVWRACKAKCEGMATGIMDTRPGLRRRDGSTGAHPGPPARRAAPSRITLALHPDYGPPPCRPLCQSAAGKIFHFTEI